QRIVFKSTYEERAPDLRGSLVHLYDDHEDKSTDQSQYRGRTELNHQELQRGNASLKLSSVQISDEGRYIQKMCFIQSKSWFDDTNVDVKVEASGTPPVITVDGFDDSGGLHLQCDSEGWYPEPVLDEKHTIPVYERDRKYHCRVKLRHHMLEAVIISSIKYWVMFNSWKTPVNLISVIVVVIVIAGLLIAVFVHKNRGKVHLSGLRLNFINSRFCLSIPSFDSNVVKKSQTFRYRTYRLNVILDADMAHPRLNVSSDGKQVRDGNTQLERVDRAEEQNDKFDKYLAVLGKEGFSSGCFYYEVQVQGQTEWNLGVARESSEKIMNLLNGYWITGLRYEKYMYLSYNSPEVLFSLRVKPQRVGVFVDYEKCQVSFYDVESSSHLYSYTDQSFDEKLYPFVSLGYMSNENSTALIILPVTNLDKQF
uniref:B30.2/SPRY domain-containing protein n=1 Tax=Sinocyclocheilus anshuiensis TaxID=1608454 RepID=A0A671T9F2_9TELE